MRALRVNTFIATGVGLNGVWKVHSAYEIYTSAPPKFNTIITRWLPKDG